MNDNKNPGMDTGEAYTPRPAWQIWAARAGAAVVALLFLWQCAQMAWGLF